jgi:hypothetical protein
MEFNNKLKPVVAPQNRGKFKGKPFWIGVVNNLDGKIEDVYDYETAKSTDFHHSKYMNPELIPSIMSWSDDSPMKVFWFNDNGDIEVGWRNQVDNRFGWMDDFSNLKRNEYALNQFRSHYGKNYQDRIKYTGYYQREKTPQTLRLIELIKRQLDK